MPTYEFHCEACDKEFSLTLTMRERSEVSIRCPTCGSDRIQSRLTPFVAKTTRKS